MILPERFPVKGFQHEQLRADMLRRMPAKRDTPKVSSIYDAPPSFRRQDASTPFQILPVEGSAKVTIYPGDVDDGFVGGIVPKIGGVFITAASPPELTVVSGSVYVRGTKDIAGAFTDCVILNAASLPANTSAYAYRQLGTVTVSGTVVTVTAQSVQNSLSHRLCAGTSTWGISG
jgi:hypothetical protein